MIQKLLCTLILISSISCSPTQGHVAANDTNNEDQEASLRTLQWLEAQYGFISQEKFEKYFPEMLSRLSSGHLQAEHLCKTRLPRKIDFRVFLLNDSQPNAFSLGSGVIVISKGLIGTLESPSELSAVLAHEMSHEYLGHIANVLREESGKRPQGFLSLEQEEEADGLSLCLLSATGVPLDSAVTALTKGYRREGSAVSSNSMVTERILKLEEKLGTLPRCGGLLSCNDSPFSSRDFRRIQRVIRESLASKSHSRGI